MKHIILFLAFLLVGEIAVAQFPSTTVQNPYPADAMTTVQMKFSRFNPSLARQIWKTEDTLRGGGWGSTILSDTTAWYPLPGALPAIPADTVGFLSVGAYSPTGDTANLVIAMQFGLNGVFDTTAAATKVVWGATTDGTVPVKFVKASTTKGWAISVAISYYWYLTHRHNNVFRLIATYPSTGNSSAAYGGANKTETVTYTHSYPKRI